MTAFAATAEPETPVEKIDVPVEGGVYYSDIELLNASNPQQFSMGNASLRGSTSFKQKQPDDPYSKSVVVVKDNKATVIVEFMPMGCLGMYGFMMELEAVDVRHLQQWGGVYDQDADFIPATVLTRHMSSDGQSVYDPFNDPDSEYVLTETRIVLPALAITKYGRWTSAISPIRIYLYSMLRLSISALKMMTRVSRALPRIILRIMRHTYMFSFRSCFLFPLLPVISMQE